MRLVLDGNTVNEILKAKDYIKSSEATLIVDKCDEGNITQRLFIQGDYKPFSAEEQKRKNKMPKFRVAIIKYVEENSEIEDKYFLTFDEAYMFFTDCIQNLKG